MKMYCFTYTNDADFTIYAESSKELHQMLVKSGWKVSYPTIMQYITRRKVTREGYFDVFECEDDD